MSDAQPACDNVHTPQAGAAKLRVLTVEDSFMSGIPTFGSPAPGRLMGVLRSWLLARSSEIWPSPESRACEPGGPSAPYHGSARVLVVDDDPVNLMVMSALMEARGLVPLLAADGAEAVALACELPFDLILMDLQMPILDGLGATMAIRRFETTSSRPAVPVIAYSSMSLGEVTLATHGMNGSLGKPCNDHELDDCLVRWCPTYRPASAVRGLAHDHRHWQPATRRPDARGASMR